jgi:hypothetical protein
MPAGRIFPDETLPVGAVPARLLCSGEYSIRCNVDLVKVGKKFVQSADVLGARLAVKLY